MRGSGVSSEENAQILLKLITKSLLLHAIMSCFKKLFILYLSVLLGLRDVTVYPVSCKQAYSSL